MNHDLLEWLRKATMSIGNALLTVLVVIVRSFMWVGQMLFTLFIHAPDEPDEDNKSHTGR